MGKALYREYRPTTLSDVIGQKHITDTLRNALAKGTISHAYLLTGPRGTGKTSVARILARDVNGVAYDPADQPVDIIEIDAASNRRIDEIRALRERVATAPTSLKYKVYIIDEVHMLTKEAFNALLKTLEEPPAHVIFILATTDFYKVPETIVSRCIRFNFKPIETDAIISHLRHIASEENVAITDQALKTLAVHARGSFRDSISLLDQVRNYGTSIDQKEVEQMFGLAPQSVIENIMEAVNAGNFKLLFKHLESLKLYGAGDDQIAAQLSGYLRGSLITDTSLDSAAVLDLLQDLQSVGPSSTLEIALLKSASSRKTTEVRLPSPGMRADKQEVKIEKVSHLDTIAEISPKTPAPQLPTDSVPPILDTPSDDSWSQILTVLKASNGALYGIARMASFLHEEDEAVLKFDFLFHYKQMSEPRNKAILNDVVKRVVPAVKTIKIEHSARTQKDVGPIVAPKKSSDATLSNITNIFGPSEVLES